MTVTTPSRTQQAVEQLRTGFSGRIVEPGDPDYDAMRSLVYGDIDPRPGAIARPTDAGDVARVVDVARRTGV